MPSFLPGQRWISDTESELGLGVITGCEGRRVTIHFPAIDESRVYAIEGAPLTRVAFTAGDQIESREGWQMSVRQALLNDGLITYLGERSDGSQVRLEELQLSDTLRIDQPKQRLLAGQIDPPHWFNLRQQTLSHLGKQQQSSLLGLVGPRIDLIPHQLYIAHEVAGRPAPRVLLADEVGLGKTIEACLILHQQLLTGRASRVLILVPDPLVHQWLVELLRRFNQKFRILDEETCQAIQDSGQADNPFHAEQLVLCSLNLFHDNPARLSQALDGEWDLLIVDEAHHLTWSEEDPSAEYLLVEALSLRTPGVLLLTATPEQLGQAGHFARLRLLDPDRYYDLQSFLQEEQHYQPVAEAVEHLLRGEPLPEKATQALLSKLDESESTPLLSLLNDPSRDLAERTEARESLINSLLDRHGTGRVLFRNTRARISGFPARELIAYPLPMPEEYSEAQQQGGNPSATLQLTPERLYSEQGHPDWWQVDPRVSWLIERLRNQADDKFLLICSHDRTAVELQQAVRNLSGISAGVFHQDMTIVERDRAAAWFADPEGARLLICSEIGSEGRNFQFAHHLILFDLPADPDLLEQRIGRLDRIGQQQTVTIHQPYMDPGPQSVMLQWYRDGLDAFRQHVPGAQQINEQLGAELWQLIEEEQEPAVVADLIERTRELKQQIQLRLQQGRDHLLELGACRQPMASQLVEQLTEQDDSEQLPDYLQRLFDCYNIETEELGAAGLILRPGEQVIAGSLPGLPADGLTATYSRSDALSHEERHFLTWEHPLVRNAMDQVISIQTGNSTAMACRHPKLSKGELLLECLFVVECPAPKKLQVGRFLPTSLSRILIDAKGRRLDHLADCDSLLEHAEELDRKALLPVINSYRSQLRSLIAAAEEAAAHLVDEQVKQSAAKMMKYYTSEIQRMQALKKHNPSVRSEEIEMLQQQGMALHQQLQSTRLRLDAVRLVVTL
ncbi:MAG: RNA polymerase-associated protein RapA [Candidatus Thiodiazotropha taylori]|nr:RNA polymerase-associated protein RapA [Candidatus Thiodiazotropha taylori]MCG8107117.1 RNA polymerase-associated protein RapA [Candidatus Thiodiazotropha taylori]MCG8110597.1 RNA polymerase-associated protein RapA [Candidatus Thiodiazotropha taylori]MCG8124204.1 RNA polymerase-associated protein RapA [Candidatus Thiodiazotropha taylori]MCW4252947.1 RNA polymerase-associated protein RapA [Candidatus Thiodiazotropha taylori]